jgi:hypothetical protein
MCSKHIYLNHGEILVLCVVAVTGTSITKAGVVDETGGIVALESLDSRDSILEVR